MSFGTMPRPEPPAAGGAGGVGSHRFLCRPGNALECPGRLGAGTEQSGPASILLLGDPCNRLWCSPGEASFWFRGSAGGHQSRPLRRLFVPWRPVIRKARASQAFPSGSGVGSRVNFTMSAGVGAGRGFPRPGERPQAPRPDKAALQPEDSRESRTAFWETATLSRKALVSHETQCLDRVPESGASARCRSACALAGVL